MSNIEVSKYKLSLVDAGKKQRERVRAKKIEDKAKRQRASHKQKEGEIRTELTK